MLDYLTSSVLSGSLLLCHSFVFCYILFRFFSCVFFPFVIVFLFSRFLFFLLASCGFVCRFVFFSSSVLFPLHRHFLVLIPSDPVLGAGSDDGDEERMIVVLMVMVS